MSDLMFPIRLDPVIKAIPWAAISPHEKQALLFHNKTLHALAREGGLTVIDAVKVMRGLDWSDTQFTEADRSAYRVALMHDLLKFERSRVKRANVA